MKSDSVIHACTVVTLLDPMFVVYTAMIRVTSLVCYLYQKHISKKHILKTYLKICVGPLQKLSYIIYIHTFSHFTLTFYPFFEIIY